MKYCRVCPAYDSDPAEKHFAVWTSRRFPYSLIFFLCHLPLWGGETFPMPITEKRGNRSFMNGSKMLTCGRDIAGMCVGHIGYVFTYPAFKVLWSVPHVLYPACLTIYYVYNIVTIAINILQYVILAAISKISNYLRFLQNRTTNTHFVAAAVRLTDSSEINLPTVCSFPL